MLKGGASIFAIDLVDSYQPEDILEQRSREHRGAERLPFAGELSMVERGNDAEGLHTECRNIAERDGGGTRHGAIGAGDHRATSRLRNNVESRSKLLGAVIAGPRRSCRPDRV